MKKILNNRGQNIMEYVLVSVAILAGVVALGFLSSTRNAFTNYTNHASAAIASFK